MHGHMNVKFVTTDVLAAIFVVTYIVFIRQAFYIET